MRALGVSSWGHGASSSSSQGFATCQPCHRCWPGLGDSANLRCTEASRLLRFRDSEDDENQRNLRNVTE
jgi:hypothetical protein